LPIVFGQSFLQCPWFPQLKHIDFVFGVLKLASAFDSADLMRFSSSELLASSSERYSSTVAHPAGERSAILISLFLLSISDFIDWSSLDDLETEPSFTRSITYVFCQFIVEIELYLITFKFELFNNLRLS